MAFLTPPTLVPQRPPRLQPSPLSRDPPRATAVTKNANTSLPPRVVLTPLPTLHIYDHCPFCVRVRHVLGLKNVKHTLNFLANDDADTPSALVGRKIVPIFQPAGPTGPAQAESLDICTTIDSDPRYGPPHMFRSASNRPDIPAWENSVAMPIRRLTRIRFSRAPLPEFVFAEARAAYIRNHPLTEPSSYEDNFEHSAEYVAQVQEKITELADMIYSPQFCTKGGLSFDDVLLFPRLRSMTIIKDLQLPSKIRDYLEFHADAAEIPLYGYCAL